MTFQYNSGDDDIASFVSSLSVCLTALGGMVLITRNSPMGGDSFDTAFLSAFLIANMTGTIVFELVMILLSTPVGNRFRGRITKRCCPPSVLEQPRQTQAVGSRAKITPVQQLHSPPHTGGEGQHTAYNDGTRQWR